MCEILLKTYPVEEMKTRKNMPKPTNYKFLKNLEDMMISNIRLGKKKNLFNRKKRVFTPEMWWKSLLKQVIFREKSLFQMMSIPIYICWMPQKIGSTENIGPRDALGAAWRAGSKETWIVSPCCGGVITPTGAAEEDSKGKKTGLKSWLPWEPTTFIFRGL